LLDAFWYSQAKFWRAHGFAVLLVAIAAYFVYHGFSGSRGYFSYLQINQHLTAAEAELRTLIAQRERLDRLIAGLEPHRIDPDLLEEYLRKNGYIRDNEVILLPDD
jgi:cell division protein FtsB